MHVDLASTTVVGTGAKIRQARFRQTDRQTDITSPFAVHRVQVQRASVHVCLVVRGSESRERHERERDLREIVSVDRNVYGALVWFLASEYNRQIISGLSSTEDHRPEHHHTLGGYYRCLVDRSF